MSGTQRLILGGLALPSAAKSIEESLSVQVFVCVSNNRADAVDRLLIFIESLPPSSNTLLTQIL